MEWLGAVGALAGVVPNIADSFNGTSKAKADAMLVSAKAQQDAVAAQREAQLLNAKANRDMMVYGLIGVGVIVSGFIVYKAVA